MEVMAPILLFLKKQIFGVLARPILIPVAVGSIGLWYGCYDISRMLTGWMLPKRLNQDYNSWARNISIAGLGSSMLYIRGRLSPESGFSMPATFNSSAVVESAKSIKGFPIRFHFTSVVASGCICGLYSSLYDSIVE